MNDHVAAVDQHPVAGFLAFHLGADAELLLQPVGQLFRNRRHLTRRPARADHHVIGHVRAPAQVDLHDIFGLVVIDRLQDRFQNLFGAVVAKARRAAIARGNRKPGCGIGM